eukprot:Gb_06203 [translate_table: standard]
MATLACLSFGLQRVPSPSMGKNFGGEVSEWRELAWSEGFEVFASSAWGSQSSPAPIFLPVPPSVLAAPSTCCPACMASLRSCKACMASLGACTSFLGLPRPSCTPARLGRAARPSWARCGLRRPIAAHPQSKW